MLDQKPLNMTVYMPICYICNHRYLSPHRICGRAICKDCIKLPADLFRVGIAKAVIRDNEKKYKD